MDESERKRIYQTKYCEKNRDRIRHYQKEYYQKNKNRLNEYRHNKVIEGRTGAYEYTTREYAHIKRGGGSKQGYTREKPDTPFQRGKGIYTLIRIHEAELGNDTERLTPQFMEAVIKLGRRRR